MTTNTTQATEGELAQFASYSAPCTSVPDAFIEALEAGNAIAAADAALTDALIAALTQLAREGDHVVFMSNGGFEGAPRRFLAGLGG